MPLALLLLLALGGTASSTTTKLTSALPDHARQVGTPRAVVEPIHLQGRQLQVGGEARDTDYVEAGAQTAVSVSATAYDKRSGDASGCGDDGCLPALAYDGVLDDDSRWSCAKDLVPDGGQCEILFSFETSQDIKGVKVSFWKGAERARTLKVKLNGKTVGEFESTAGAITTTYNIEKNDVRTVTLESIGLDSNEWISLIEVYFMAAPGGSDDDDSGLTCEGGIPGIQQSDVCCPISCGSCAGAGCTGRDGGDTFTGREACCGGGVRSLGRVCSAEVGAPCVVVPEEEICSPGVPGILVRDVCCPTSCGSCAGAGCTGRDGGDTFTGREACCGGGVRSLGRVCSAEVGAPCVVVPEEVGVVCEMALAEAIPVPTALGGSSVTVTASLCKFHPSAIFSIATAEGDVLTLVAGELVDDTTAKFTLPNLPMATKVVMVTAASATGQLMVGRIQVFGMDALLEYPSAGFSDTDGIERTSVITDPPSDLLLKWDESTISADSVEIVLVASVPGTEELDDVAVLSMSPNTGSYLIQAAALDEFDLEGSFVLFKIVGRTSSRRLQDSGLTPIVFPEIVTTGLVAWLEDLEGNESSTELCSTAFSDDFSKCQCFFTAEKFKPRRGVQLDAFDGKFRCPANVGCILDAPPGLVTVTSSFGFPVTTYEDLSSSSLSSGWNNDRACPFGSCLFDSVGDDRTVLSCARNTLKAVVFDVVSEAFLGGVDACELHPGAEFCVRTDEATSNGANTDIGNQCCYDNTGNILVDATTGGGTVDRREAELGGFSEHKLEDTLPFKWCCDGGGKVESWLCQMYIEMRPVDAGDGYVGGDGATPAGCSVAPEGGTVISKTQTFSVQVPEQAESSVDFGLLVDVSGSYSDDIANLKSLAAKLVEGLSTDSAGVDVQDLRMGLGSYSDIPTESAPSDSPYTLVKPFGNCGGAGDEDEASACWQQERDNFISSVNTLDTESGGDSEESQTIALVEAATTWEWREAALKILAITTDAGFHLPGDGSEFSDQYPSLDAVISACNDRNIKILALKSRGATADMDKIALGTGGVIETTTSNSSDIVEKILAGIEKVQYKKIDVEWACRDSSFELKSWTHTQSPSSGYENVDGGVELEFTVTVSVPSGVKAGIRCVALVVADEILIGGQEFVALDAGTISAAAIDVP